MGAIEILRLPISSSLEKRSGDEVLRGSLGMRKEREGGRGRKWGEAGREGRRLRTVFVESAGSVSRCSRLYRLWMGEEEDEPVCLQRERLVKFGLD